MKIPNVNGTINANTHNHGQKLGPYVAIEISINSTKSINLSVSTPIEPYTFPPFLKFIIVEQDLNDIHFLIFRHV